MWSLNVYYKTQTHITRHVREKNTAGYWEANRLPFPNHSPSKPSKNKQTNKTRQHNQQQQDQYPSMLSIFLLFSFLPPEPYRLAWFIAFYMSIFKYIFIVWRYSNLFILLFTGFVFFPSFRILPIIMPWTFNSYLCTNVCSLLLNIVGP